MKELHDWEKAILRDALTELAIQLITIYTPNGENRIVPEPEFLTNPEISQERKNHYLRTMGLRAEIDNLRLV